MSTPISIALSSYEKEAVLNVIKANPTWTTVDQLGDAFIEQAIAKPYNVDKIANVISSLEVDPSVPVIKIMDTKKQIKEDPFDQILSTVIFEAVKRQFEDKDTAIEPTNTFLISALISGAAVRSGLCNSSTQSGMITLGLRFDSERQQWKEMIPEEKSELWAIHAVLHLLAGGRRIYREEQIGYRQAELLPALKAISEQNVIAHPQGKKLLKVAVGEATAGFETDLPIVDIWKTLFP